MRKVIGWKEGCGVERSMSTLVAHNIYITQIGALDTFRARGETSKCLRPRKMIRCLISGSPQSLPWETYTRCTFVISVVNAHRIACNNNNANCDGIISQMPFPILLCTIGYHMEMPHAANSPPRLIA